MDREQLLRGDRARAKGIHRVRWDLIGNAIPCSRRVPAPAIVHSCLRIVHYSLCTVFPRTIEKRGLFPVKRNTIVLGITLLILATFAWAGWANWEYRKQAAERALASASHAELVPNSTG